MSRRQADDVALANDGLCCCDAAKGIGRKAPREGFFSSVTRTYFAGASRQIMPTFKLSEDRHYPKAEEVLGALLFVGIAVALGLYVGWSLWGARP